MPDEPRRADHDDSPSGRSMRQGRVPSPGSAVDVVVVGSGVAGLRSAIELAEAGRSVALLAKDTATDSNTEKAQGGVAVALSDEDRVGLHHDDTLKAGAGLCDEDAVAVLVGEGPRYISELIEWGARFDKEGSRLAFTREAAHSTRRVLHAQGDATGREILRALWNKAASLDAITFYPHTFSIDLTVRDGVVRGLEVLDETCGAVRILVTGSVILATGGAGRVFSETTNPPQATGDGIAIAWRAGARLRDMEFVQFHPTALHVPGAPRFLLSEALRGEGGLLRGADGRRFMTDVDDRAELAPRDVVARAIVREMTRTGADHVLLDMTHLDGDYLQRRFPRIVATCRLHGLDITSVPVPVAPAAHYIMGGVATDLQGRTSVDGLYAAGEVACTGVHGANRLASNSLLEGLVFGARAGQAVLADGAVARPFDTDALGGRGAGPDDGGVVRRIAELRADAWECLGILRDHAGLERIIRTSDEAVAQLNAETRPGGIGGRAALEGSSMAALAGIIGRCALARRESRGAHFRGDYPRRDDVGFGASTFIDPATGKATIGDGGEIRPRRVPSSR